MGGPFSVSNSVGNRKESGMGRIAISIDAAYFQYVPRDEFGCARIDFGKLVHRMADGREILRAHSMTASPVNRTLQRPKNEVGSARPSDFTTHLIRFQDSRFALENWQNAVMIAMANRRGLSFTYSTVSVRTLIWLPDVMSESRSIKSSSIRY